MGRVKEYYMEQLELGRIHEDIVDDFDAPQPPPPDLFVEEDEE